MVMIKNPKRRIELPLVNSFLLLIIFFFFTGATLADEASDPVAEAKYSKGANSCMSCHREGRDKAAHEVFLGPMGISDSPDSPFADGRHDCETCHGPSDSHRKKQKDGSRLLPGVTFNSKTPAVKQNEICLACHNEGTHINWPGSTHEEEDVACASCHEVHAPQDPAMDKLAQQEKCFSCHPRTRAATFKASSHPLRFGTMTCSDCHSPHDGSNDYLLIESTVNETCYRCHAEKRGPYLWEHAPVTEDCTLCHNVHGSNHAMLLKKRPPLLCQTCHSIGGHPSTAYTPETAESSFQQRFLLGRSCSNCHSQVHGSNHPSGVIQAR